MQEQFSPTPPEVKPAETQSAQARRIGKTALREIVETIALFIVVMAISRATIGNYIIEQTSAVPNYMPGDRILVDQQIYKVIGGLHRGDLIVLDRNREFEREWFTQFVEFWQGKSTHERLFKRIIGLPGETVEIKDNGVFINGERLTEPYVAPENHRNGLLPLRKLGDDEYWVMGDNRGGSQDSRNWNSGIKSGDVVGRAWLRYFPLEKFQLIRGVSYGP